MASMFKSGPQQNYVQHRSHSQMTPRQLLTRYSFQSLFRSEALSEAGVDGYRAWVISVGVALFIFHLYLARVLARKYGIIAKTQDFQLFQSAVAADELFYLSASFVMITLVATLQWQSLFPGERDFQVLAPLPIRRADIFLARILALALFLAIFLVTFNLPPALLFPAFARGPWPAPPFAQSLAAHLVSGLGASLHAFLCVLALQGLCLTTLPHRIRSQASFLIQSTLLTATIACIPIVWHMPGLNRLLDTRAAWIGWIPPVWWVGVCEVLRGSPDPWFQAMATRALVATTLALGISALTYWQLYRRFSDFSQPQRPPTPRQSPLLQLARWNDNGAIVFLAWTIARSAQHRLILSAIAAVGASLAFDGFISGYIRQWTKGRGAGGLFLETALALPLLLTFGLTTALRMSFRIPHEWRAHWVFRITETNPTRPDQLEAAVTAQYLAAVLPSALVAIPFQLIALGPWQSLAAQPLLLGAAACLIEFTMQDWQRMPFTATYAPSHRPAAISFVFFVVAFSSFGWGGAAIIKALLSRPVHWTVTVALLTAATAILRRKRRSHWGHEPYTFADNGDPTVQVTNFAPE